MDILPLIFYAVICGALSALSPAVPSWPVRALIGAGVGIAAASCLPLLRDLLFGA